MTILLLKLWHNTLFSQLKHFLFCFFCLPMKGGHSLVVTSTDPIKTTLNDSQSEKLTSCSHSVQDALINWFKWFKISKIFRIFKKFKIFCSTCSDQFMLWSSESKVANCAALLAEKPKREPVLMMGIMGRWVQQSSSSVPAIAFNNLWPSSLLQLIRSLCFQHYPLDSGGDNCDLQQRWMSSRKVITRYTQTHRWEFLPD